MRIVRRGRTVLLHVNRAYVRVDEEVSSFLTQRGEGTKELHRAAAKYVKKEGELLDVAEIAFAGE